MAYKLNTPRSIFIDSWFGLDGESSPYWPIPWAWWSDTMVSSSGIGSHINYAVEIYTETNETNTDIGLEDGVFRLITGRPNYSGGCSCPQWGPNEWEVGINYYKWYQGFISKDGLSNPVRRIDISKAGDYGTLSDFTLKLRNNNLIWTYFRNDNESSSINLLNKEIKVYVVIDDTFYQIWGGVITDTPRNEQHFALKCSDYPSKFHKSLPKNLSTEAIAANFGNNEYIKGVAISNSNIIPLNADNESTPILQARVNFSDSFGYTFDLLTMGVTFASGELAGKYLFVNNFNTNDVAAPSNEIDKDFGLYIDDNEATSTISGFEATTIYSLRGFKTTPKILDINSFNQFHAYLGTLTGVATSSYNCTYVKCIDIQNNYKLGQSDVALIENVPYKYDEDTKTYVKLPTTITNNGDGTVTMVTSKTPVTNDGFNYYKGIDINIENVAGFDDYSYTYSGISDSGYLNSILQNGDQTDYIEFDVTGTSMSGFYITALIDLPADLDTSDLWILPDITTTPISGDANKPASFSVIVEPVDPVGYTMDIDFINEIESYNRGFKYNWPFSPGTVGGLTFGTDLSGYALFYVPDELYTTRYDDIALATIPFTEVKSACNLFPCSSSTVPVITPSSSTL